MPRIPRPGDLLTIQFRKTCRRGLICTWNDSAAVSGVLINTPAFGRHITASQCGLIPLISPCTSELGKPLDSVSTYIASAMLQQASGRAMIQSTCEASRTFSVKLHLLRPRDTTSWRNRGLPVALSLGPSSRGRTAAAVSDRRRIGRHFVGLVRTLNDGEIRGLELQHEPKARGRAAPDKLA